MPHNILDRRTEAVRAFNRFYTSRIGVVREGYLQSRFSLTEARVLYELAQTEGLTATQIGTALELDAGYLSRMLRQFEQDGLLTRGPSPIDRRQSVLTLTKAGRAAFAPLDQRSRREKSARCCPRSRTRLKRLWLVACKPSPACYRINHHRTGPPVTLLRVISAG
jgi:DNA-binding MarR family transcriptional regulator